MQIKSTMRYHLTMVTMAVIKKTRSKCWEECGEKGNVGGNGSWCHHLGKRYGESSKKKERERKLLCDPAIPLLDTYPKERKLLSWRYICPPMFIEIWKQLQYRKIDAWIKEMWHIYVYIHTHKYVYMYMMLMWKGKTY